MGSLLSNHHHELREMPHKVHQLHIAVMTNDRDTVKSLLAQGVNINYPWYNPSNPSVKDGNTALISAVSLNYFEIVQLLLGAGAYVNKCDRSGCTPVFKAAFHGRPILIELLTKSGADVNLSDFKGQTPLYVCVNNAIVHSCRTAIQKLLAAGAIVDKRDNSGQAPVHIASRWKLRDVLQMLIAAHCDVNICDRKGRTPLYVCVSSLSTKLYFEDLQHQLPIIVTLFRAGADMLNLTEWLHYKGPGIPDSLITDSPDFLNWYYTAIRQPLSLKNLCRKVVQKRTRGHGDLSDVAQKLPIPSSVQIYVARRTFYREENQSPG